MIFTADSIAHQEFKSLMNAILKDHLSRFGMTDEPACDYVGLQLTTTPKGIRTTVKNPNAVCLENRPHEWEYNLINDVSNISTVHNRKGLVKSQLLRCIDCVLTKTTAHKAIITFSKEFQIIGYGKILPQV